MMPEKDAFTLLMLAVIHASNVVGLAGNNVAVGTIGLKLIREGTRLRISLERPLRSTSVRASASWEEGVETTSSA